jgi:hypothetical protein
LGEHRLVLGDRPVGVVGVQVHRAQVGAHARVFGVEGQILLIVVDGFGVLLEVIVDVPDSAQGVKVIGRQFEDVAEGGERGAAVAGIEARGPRLCFRQNLPGFDVLRGGIRLLH